jgi:6-phosphogluconolactonase
MKSVRILLAALLAALALLQTIPTAAERKEAEGLLVYTGTYTRGNSRGIYVHRFNPTSGKITSVGLAAETSNPSFLIVHPSGRFLYAVNENESGTISSFAIDRATGILKSLNKVSSRGGGPCHLAFDRTGKWLFVANYNNGSIAMLPVHEDGTLGEAQGSFGRTGSGVNPVRQAGPHAHSVNISPDNQILLVADLGLDAIFRFKFDARKGQLIPYDSPAAKTPGGSGPRHLTWSTNGKFVYVLNEMTSTVAAFKYEKGTGRLDEIESLALPADNPGGPRSSAEIVMHPSGKVLYASNRTDSKIVAFDVVANGQLTVRDATPSGGRTPRHFALTPGGGFLFAANQDSNNVAVFRVDGKTGALAASGTTFAVTSPVCVVFVEEATQR